MRPTLLRRIGVLFSIILLYNIGFSNTEDYCKYNDDPIIVDSDHFRTHLQLSGAENLITLCDLKIGETYDLSGFSPIDLSCAFSFKQFGAVVGDVEFDFPLQNEGSLNLLAFTATAECMDFVALNNECTTASSYPVNLSVVCVSCEEPAPLPATSNSLLPIISADPNWSAEDLIAEIFIGGDCFDVSGVTSVGSANGMGLFTEGLSSIGLDKGIVLSTGFVTNIPGPCGPNASSSNGGAGDSDLAQLAGINVGDAVGIEFDFIPTLDALSFTYSFASEEYCEFVGQYNDAFGFFISGPGINGPYSNNAENIALVPGTNTEVSINTVNQNTNSGFFNPNATGSCGSETNCADIKFDGYTAVLTASIDGLTACETYHIKLVIGDANDAIFDSAVFLGKGSFDAGGDLSLQAVVPNGNDNNAIEACQDGQLIFTRNLIDLDQPLTITFNVGGTATPGVDYVPFPTTITFPAGQQVFIIDVDILPDAIVEGIENITIILDQDACSCSGQAGELLIEDYIPLEIPEEDISVCGQQSSTISPPVTGGAPSLNYSWSTGSNSPSINVNPSVTTTYTLTVTDQCGNSEEGDFTINVTEAPTATLVGNAAVCAGDPNPTATLTVTFTGEAPWDLVYFENGVAQPPITGITTNPYSLIVNSTGNYSLSTVENAACPGTVSGAAVVSEVDVELTALPIDVLCNGGTTGSVDLTVISGDPAFMYNWSNGSTAQDLDNVPFGPYSVTVTDMNGCTEIANVDIAEPPLLTSEVFEIAPINCNGDFTGAIDLTTNGGSPNYTYQWSNGSQSEDISQLTAGTYTVTVSDQNNCTSVSSITLNEPAAMGANIFVVQDVSCFEGSDGAVDLSVLGGTQPYFYAWTGNGGTVEDPNNLMSGSYTVEVTDINGCTTIGAVSISEPPPIIAQVTETQGVDCNNPSGGAADLVLAGGTPNYTFNWDNGSFDEDPNNLDAGPHYVTITDALGCTQTAEVIITSNTEEPVVDINVDGLISCASVDVTLDGSGSTGNGTLEYEWQDAGGMVVGTGATTVVSTAGEYTLIVTGDNGCTSSLAAMVDEDSNIPSADISASNVLDCINVNSTLDGSGSSGMGALEYEWFDSAGNSIATTVDIDVANPDDYTLIVTDTGNGCTAETTFNLIQDIVAPSSNAGPGISLTCADTEVSLDGSGSSAGSNITYEWLNDGNVTVGTTVMIDVAETGVYTLVVTNEDNGCTASSTVEVTPDANLPTADAGLGSSLTCIINEVTLDGSGSSAGSNISYEWLDPNGVPISIDLMIDVDQIGTYTLVVTDDSNGCSASSSVAIMEDITSPDADAGLMQFITCSETVVTLDGSGSSGGNLSYQWLDAGGIEIGTTVSVDVTSAEEYTLIVTNQDNGCTESATVEIQEDTNLPVSNAGQDGLLNCIIQDFTLDASNSTGGTLEYDWQDSNGTTIGTTPTVDVSVSGTYTLIVTDTDNGCTATSTAFVDQDINAPTAEAGDNGLLSCLVNSTDLDAGASTGGTLTYEWQNDIGDVVGTTPTISTTETGVYTVLVTDTDNGCTSSDQVEVLGDYETPIVDAGQDGLLTCEDLVATLDGSGSSGNGTLSYEWFDDSNISIASSMTFGVDQPGTYTLVITDEDNGCTESATVIIDQDIAAPTSNAGQGATLTCDDTEVTLIGSGTSQSGNISYEWLNEGGVSVGTNPSVTVSQIGTYTLVVTDTDNGCTTTSTVAVVPDANLPIANAGLSSTLTCDETLATLDGINSSSGANINYDWQDSNGVSIGTTISLDVMTPGVYTLIVTDSDNGCTASSSVEIFENVEAPNAFAGTDPTLTCDETSVTLDGSGSTISTGGLTFEWLDPQGNIIATTATITVDESGIYTLNATGDNGCTASDQVEVLVDANVPVADVGMGGILDCNVTVITLGGNSTSTGPDITYEWQDQNGATIASTATFDVSIPGDYTLIVSNASNNCETTALISIPQDIEAPTADVGVAATLTCDLSIYEIGGAGSSTGSEFTYEWTNANGDIISNDMTTEVTDPDTYTLLITNTTNGCTTTDAVIIDQNIETPVSNAGQGGILTCDVSQVTLDGSSSTGSNLSFEWLNESGVIVSNAAIFDASETGMYTLVVTNTSNGCTSTSMASITPDANLPTALVSPSGILTCVVGDIDLDGTASSSISGNIAYEWQDENQTSLSTADNYNTSIPGLYTLIVTDTDNGCTASTTVEVLQDIEAPTSDAGTTETLICGQTDVTLNGVGGNGANLDYEWQNDQQVTIGTTPMITVTSPGLYTLLVTNLDNGCTASSAVAVVPDQDLPTANAGTAETLTCTTTAVTLDGSGSSTGSNFSYEWQDENGAIVGTALTLSVDNPGAYTLTVINNDNNCQSEDQIFVMEDVNDPTAFADYGSAQSLDCNNTSIALDGSGSAPFGSLTFEWSTINGNIVTGGTTINPEIDEPGTYTLVVTNTVNGCTDTQNITIAENITPPNVNIQNPDILTCAITEIIIDATNSSNTGDLTYAWSGNGIIAGGTTLEPTVNQTGTFTLTIINNENGCESEASIGVDEDVTPPVAVATATEEFDCITESVSLNGNGSSTGSGISYLWTGVGQVENETSLNPIVFQSGVYTILVTDASNGCTQSSNVTVLEDTNVPSAIDAFVDNPLCFGEDGSISIYEVIGGTAPYLISIDDGQNFSTQTLFANLNPGNYDLVIQDALGCEYNESLTIEGQEELIVELEPSVLLQFGDNYQIETFVNYDLDDIDTIIWSPTTGLSCTDCLNPSVDTVLQQASYTVTIINENGCAVSDEIYLRVQKDKDVYIPNAFSPGNGDGINDFLTVFGNDRRINKINSFQVFNRWGELVYEKFDFQPNNPTEGWNGMFRGELLNPAVFVYWTEVEFIDGSVEIFKGDVTIVD